MILIATKNGTVLSRLIRFLTNQEASHFAVVFDNKFLFHSNLYGCHPQWYSTFLKKHEIVKGVNLPMTLLEEEAVYQSIVQHFDGKSYDLKGLLYAGWRFALKKFFNVPLPSKNEWADKDKFMCTEVFNVLPKDIILTIFPKDQDISMITPIELIEACIIAKVERISQCH